MRERKNLFFKICISFIAIFLILINFNYTNAAGDGSSLLSNMESQAKNFIDKGSKAAEGNINYTNIANEFKGLGQILTMIGAGVMVAVTTYMGIKYLTAGPEAQAKLKVQLIGVVVSGMVIFGAFYIWQLVINVASSL